MKSRDGKKLGPGRALTAILALGLGLGLNLGLNLAGASPAAAQAAKNVILVIGDGMNLEHEQAGSNYLYGRDNALTFQNLAYQGLAATWDVSAYNAYASDPQLGLGWGKYSADNFNPLVGYNPTWGGYGPTPTYSQPEMADTYYLKNLLGAKPAATDSASAATAMYTGQKTDDGNIAWATGDPAGGALETIAEKMRNEKGAAIGVASTVEFNHATPAAMVSHNVNRNNYSPDKNQGTGVMSIAEEIVEVTQPDVVIGAGHPDYSPGYLNDALIADIKDNYVYVERQSGVDGGDSLMAAASQAAATGSKLWGLYGGAGGNFEYNYAVSSPGNPTIVRGSEENPTFADLATAGLEVLSQDPDGFMYMIEQGDLDWANHANDWNNMVGCVWDLDQGVQAVIDYVNQGGDDVTWDNTLMIVTSDHSNSYLKRQSVLGQGEVVNRTLAGTSAYGDPIWAYDASQVTYGTGEHTNEPVSVYAMGAGSELFASYEGQWYGGNLIDNTNIFDVMQTAAGVSGN
ncbi:MAG: alkaline phosphatase [Deltaproteobacteria bacterium]|nr:alkaline phosphatase [Deltaproteobacteria bacterium]